MQFIGFPAIYPGGDVHVMSSSLEHVTPCGLHPRDVTFFVIFFQVDSAKTVNDQMLKNVF